MPEPVPNAPLPLSSPASLTPRPDEIDLPCARCGYDLRDLPLNRACPECNAPIARSAQGNLLRFAAPEYRRRLHRGARLIVVGVHLLVAPPVIALCLHFMAALLPYASRIPQSIDRFAPTISIFAMAAGAVLICAGWARFASPDPESLGLDHGQAARRWSRMTAIALLLSIIACFGLIATRSSLPGVPFGRHSVSIGLMLVIFAHFYAAGHVLVSISKRAPDPTAQLQSRHAYRLSAIGALLSIASLINMATQGRFVWMSSFATLAAVVLLVLAFFNYAVAIDRVRGCLVDLSRNEPVTSLDPPLLTPADSSSPRPSRPEA